MKTIRKSNNDKKQKRPYLSPSLLLFTFITLAFCSFAKPCMADATMYRCTSHTGEKIYTNIPNYRKCVPLAIFSPPKKHRNVGKKAFKDNHTYDDLIRTIAAKYDVDDALIKAIIHIESGFNHWAISRKGARGLMQLMPETSRELQVLNPFTPQQNIDAGVRYFRQIMNDFNGDISLSLAAYNAGPNLVRRIGRIPAIPETRNYVRKVLKMYQIYKDK